MSGLKAWFPLIGTVLTGILTAFAPAITAWVSAHPDSAVLLGTILAAASHFVPPPDTTPVPKV